MASFTKPCFSQLHTNSVFLHSCIKAASSSHKHPSRVPRLSTHDSFHCISYNGHLPKGETCCSLLSALLVPMKPQLFRECWLQSLKFFPQVIPNVSFGKTQCIFMWEFHKMLKRTWQLAWFLCHRKAGERKKRKHTCTSWIHNNGRGSRLFPLPIVHHM